MSFSQPEERSIGLFDSGVGGLTVLQALRQRLPLENFIYFGDTARVPYGGKSRDTILRYSIENAKFLCDQHIKLLVVACNTASAYALAELEQRLSIPVVGVIEAGVDAALASSKSHRIAVMGTQGTIFSGVYQKLIEHKQPGAQVISVACPLLVPLVEENFRDHPATRLIIEEYLKPLQGNAVDTLLLGCTHYPLLRPHLQQVVGTHVQIVDSASSCAEKTFQTLRAMNSLCRFNESPRSCYYVSDDPKKFSSLATSFCGETVEAIQKFDGDS